MQFTNCSGLFLSFCFLIVSEADDETYYSQSSRSYSSAGSVSGSSVGDASSAAEEEDNASFNSHTLDDGSMSQLSASTYSNHSKSSLRR